MEAVKSKCVATYEYHDEAGKLLFVCKRWEPGRNDKSKDFSYSRPQTDGKGWINNLDGVKKVIYRLPEIADSRKKEHPVFVVEGEKCVEAIRWLGLLGTCNPCGAEKWPLDFGKYLTGRRVVILPDNDDAGWRHALQVAGSLLCWEAAAIWILHLPGLPDAGDVCDWIKAFPQGTKKDLIRAELVKLIKSAKKWECK